MNCGSIYVVLCSGKFLLYRVLCRFRSELPLIVTFLPVVSDFIDILDSFYAVVVRPRR